MNRSFLSQLNLLLWVFLVPFSFPAAHAGTLFFKTCEGSSKLCAVDENDPHWSQLFAIRLQHEWPMSLAYEHLKEESRTDEERIQDELKNLNDAIEARSTEKRGHYFAVWVPPTLYEKAALNMILQSRDKLDPKWNLPKDQRDKVSHFERTGAWPEGFLPPRLSLNVAIKNRSEHANNVLDSELYGRLNAKLFEGLEIHALASEGKRKPDEIQNEILRTDFLESILKKMSLAQREIIKSSYRVYDPQSYGLFLGDYGDYEGDQLQSIEKAIVLREAEAFQRGERDTAFLYRGTTGIRVEAESGKFQGIDAGIHADCLQSTGEIVPKATMSLSYGTSFWAGRFKDCGSVGAMAAGYFLRSPSLGYLLMLNKTTYRQNPATAEMPFYVPPRGPIRGLLGNGELFHSRSALGSKEIPQEHKCKRPNDIVKGYMDCISRTSVAELEGTFFNPQLTHLDTAAQVTRYIASHAIPISEDGEMISDARAKELLEGQKVLADLVEARVHAAKASSAR